MSQPVRPITLLFGALSLVASPLAIPTLSQASAATALTPADTDKDGTLDIKEVKAAAALEFDKLDTDKDGTIDLKEAAHHISEKNFIAADPDKDKTLTKAEYIALAVTLFKAANPDHDHTIDAKELHSTAGIELDRVIR
jgi:Ca2+-binding EF-hand superfamily protein